MTQLPFDIRHGQFEDVIGTPVSHDGVVFVPAHVKLDGTSFSPQFPFVQWCNSTEHPIPAIVHGDQNAPWVLGRLMAVFNSENVPEHERAEKSCFYASFLAVLNTEHNLAIPFACSDYYGHTSLYFSSENPPADEFKAMITNAFYPLLLAAPTNLVDYENQVYNSTTGRMYVFGVFDGVPYMDASE